MSENLESDVIGGRSLRSRKSLALKSKENVEPVTPRAVKTPARRATRKSSVPSETPSKTPAAKKTVKKAKSFAEVKEQDEALASAKDEILALQKEMAQLRQDKLQVEEQLKEALEEPITVPATIPERDEEEIENMKTMLETVTAEKEAAIAEKLERERLFEEERVKLRTEMEKWKGQFEQYRETETERLKREEEDEAVRAEQEKSRAEEIERRDREIAELREKQELISKEKEEKEAKSDALDSMLESLRGQLENVDIARKTATTQAETNKQLANDLRDVYEDKLARLAKKCEQWRREADKQNSEAKRYREERNKYRDRCDDFRRGKSGSSSSSDRSRAESNENGLDMLRSAYKEATSRDSAKSVDSVKSTKSNSSSRSRSSTTDKSPPRDPRKQSDDRELEDLVITSQFTTNRTKRTVLAEGEAPPPTAVKAPMRVAIEPYEE